MTLQRGCLGISAMDTGIQSPFGIPESTPEISLIHVAPWTPRDAWSIAGLFVLFQHLLTVSLEMSHVPEMLCIFMALAWTRTGWDAIGFRKFNWNALKLGCKLLILLYVINGLHSGLLYYFGLATYPHQIFGYLGDKKSWWLMLPVIIIIGPLTEEILFRGLLFAGFRQGYGWQTAAAISSGLFALSHLSFAAVIPAFASGYIFAYLYQRTGSIWPGILMHCFINTVGVCAWSYRIGFE
jgi:uncharacterized protein